MDNLYSKSFGTVSYDRLIAGTTHPIDHKAVVLKAGQGVLSRGTVLGIITASDLAVKVDSSKSDGSQTADCILVDPVDTGAPGATENITAVAYESGGPFNRDALSFGGTDTVAKHETRLRELGIYLVDTIS